MGKYFFFAINSRELSKELNVNSYPFQIPKETQQNNERIFLGALKRKWDKGVGWEVVHIKHCCITLITTHSFFSVLTFLKCVKLQNMRNGEMGILFCLKKIASIPEVPNGSTHRNHKQK